MLSIGFGQPEGLKIPIPCGLRVCTQVEPMFLRVSLPIVGSQQAPSLILGESRFVVSMKGCDAPIKGRASRSSVSNMGHTVFFLYLLRFILIGVHAQRRFVPQDIGSIAIAARHYDNNDLRWTRDLASPDVESSVQITHHNAHQRKPKLFPRGRWDLSCTTSRFSHIANDRITSIN